MKIKEYDNNWCPELIDERCLELCRVLNQLPSIETYESCEGHGKHPYWIFFRCSDIGTISRLGRCVAKNYSDNNWEIVVDSVDGYLFGCFWLRTKSILNNDELNESIKQLIDSIYYWFDDDFDKYFEEIYHKIAMLDCTTCANYNKECYPENNIFKCQYPIKHNDEHFEERQ